MYQRSRDQNWLTSIAIGVVPSMGVIARSNLIKKEENHQKQGCSVSYVRDYDRD